ATLSILPTSRAATTAETTPTTFLLPTSPTQLKTFVNPTFTSDPPFPPDTTRMTLVLTHGWNSTSTDWPTRVALFIINRLGPNSPNIFAWDWTQAAQSGNCQSGIAEAQTQRQGAALGQALITKLGSDYSQPVHF